MENNIFNINTWYMGEVRKVNTTTHELEVYVPRITPTLNYGFSNTTYTTGVQSTVLKTNTIICKPYNFKTLIPDVGSIVEVKFLGEDIKSVYWRDFDPFGNNVYIPFEKTEAEKILSDFTEMFSTSKQDDIWNLVPKGIKVNIGTEANQVWNIHGWIDVGYIVGLDDLLNKLLKGIYESVNNNIGAINKLLDDVKEINVDIGKLQNHFAEWTNTGKVRDAGNRPEGDIIWQRSLSINLGTATPGTINERSKYVYELFELENTVNYFKVYGNYSFDGDLYPINTYHLRDNGDEVISSIIVDNGKTFIFNSITTEELEPTDLELIIEVTTVDNKIPKHV